ncbi:hypothetical protein J3A65_004513 [Rhizobium sp. PvP014]|nr:hypothetical protein [Rhizobium sp. PvP014]
MTVAQMVGALPLSRAAGNSAILRHDQLLVQIA